MTSAAKVMDAWSQFSEVAGAYLHIQDEAACQEALALVNDLPELGSKLLVSRILSGERNLTRKHIQALSERFGVSPANSLLCLTNGAAWRAFIVSFRCGLVYDGINCISDG